MLQCSGLVAIPSQPNLQFIAWNNNQGFFVNFDAVAQEPVKDKSKDFHKIHHYQVSMIISKDKKDFWKNLIKPGEVFLIRTANYSSIRREGFTHSFPQVKVTENNFLHLKQAHWYT